jgi:hypothetical protein
MIIYHRPTSQYIEEEEEEEDEETHKYNTILIIENHIDNSQPPNNAIQISENYQSANIALVANKTIKKQRKKIKKIIIINK